MTNYIFTKCLNIADPNDVFTTAQLQEEVTTVINLVMATTTPEACVDYCTKIHLVTNSSM